MCREYEKYFTYKKPEELIEQLLDYNIISSDYKIFFIGNVLNIRNDKEYSFISNLDKYKNIIFNQAYNDYLNTKKEVLTLDMINTIDNLLESDKSNYNIALQMLYSFDPKPYAYTIAKMINKKVNWRGIQYSSFWKSTKFKKYINLLGLETKGFPYTNTTLMIKTFDICCPEDKEKIVTEIFDEASENIKTIFNNIKFRPFLKDANLEPPKFIYNEKDYYNPGKQE